jgi:hypothetical protein
MQIAIVCGAFFSTLFSCGCTPCSISAISLRMVMSASTKRSSSALSSDSVGSTMMVPATGHDMVGA